MILVDTLYQKVQDTLVKNQSGYFSNEEFNLNIELAQNDVMDFYVDRDGLKQTIHDALTPFLKKFSSAISNPISLPADYRSKRSAYVVVNRMMGSDPIFDRHPCEFLQTDEAPGTLSSPILKPNVDTNSYWYEIDESGITVYPETLSGTFNMLYVRNPLAASRAVTVNPTTQTEEYDAGSTVNLEWSSRLINVFHDVICFYQGFQIRESEVVQWLMANKPVK